MTLVQIRVYSNYGSKEQYTYNDVNPTSIRFDKSRRTGRMLLAFDIYKYGLNFNDRNHTFFDIEPDTTYSIFPNNFEV